MSADPGPGNREVAYRLFAAEFDDSTVSYSESDEERAPNYVITPTGGRVNRLFLVGVLTETERVGGEQLRGRVVDPTGAFVAYAGQYQPDELAFLDRTEPPAFLAITGKARTFSPDDSDRVYTSVRPESISEVDAGTRDRWVVRTAEQTLDRVATMASALRSDLRGEELEVRLVEEGVDPGLADGIGLAVEHYGTSSAYLQGLRETALDALRVVAGERDEVDRFDLAPDEGGTDDAVLAGLAEFDLGTTEADTGGAVGEAAAATATERNEPVAPSERDTSTDSPPSDEPDEATGATAEAAGDERRSGPERSSPGGTSASATESEASVADSGSEPPEADVGDDEPSAGGESDPVGEADPSDVDAADGTAAPDEGAGEIGDFEPGEFELPEEEREEIEAEYGTDFETAGEVGPAGEAGIETTETEPEPDEPTGTVEGTTASGSDAEPAAEAEPSETTAEATGEGSAEATGEGSAEATTGEGSADTDDGGESEPADDGAGGDAEGDVDVDEVTVEVIAELDDGDGADREAVVSTVADRHGVAPESVADAIEAAMMSGRAYEPSDGRLKAI